MFILLYISSTYITTVHQVVLYICVYYTPCASLLINYHYYDLRVFIIYTDKSSQVTTVYFI